MIVGFPIPRQFIIIHSDMKITPKLYGIDPGFFRCICGLTIISTSWI
jgi:hypothetical protein